MSVIASGEIMLRLATTGYYRFFQDDPGFITGVVLPIDGGFSAYSGV